MEEDSIKETLKAVKNLIKSPQKYTLSDQEVLELTEDDIYDELDEDYQDPDEFATKSEKIGSVNQFLTSFGNNYSNNHSRFERNEENRFTIDPENVVSKEAAAKSAAHLRNMIKKMEMPVNRVLSSDQKIGLEKLIFDSLKPYLEEWLEQNVSNIIRKELKSAVHNQNEKKT